MWEVNKATTLPDTFRKNATKSDGGSRLKNKILIVSYSYSGNTHRIAQEIQWMTGGDWCEIYPWQPYPMSFPALLEQVKEEVKVKYKPRLLPVKYSPREYNIIFAGAPNWCGTLPPPFSSWLYRNDLSGKIILPFSSHCGGVPGNMQKDMARLCPKAEVREALSIINDGGDGLTEKISCWLRENEIPDTLGRRRSDEKDSFDLSDNVHGGGDSRRLWHGRKRA